MYARQTTIGVQGYANETTSLLAADLLISFSDLLGGLVLLYRCWIIWGKWYLVVIPPLLSALGGFGKSISPIHSSPLPDKGS